MPTKKSTSEGYTTEFGHQTVTSEIDQLIADAEAAAIKAQLAVVEQKKSAVLRRKQTAQESAERVNELEQYFAGLNAADDFVDSHGFEWIFTASETETGVARPEGIDKTIADLRKAGAALRKLAAVEPKTESLIQTIKRLQTLHDNLFDQVKSATADALDVVRKKYTGEMSELEERHKELADSPLIRITQQEPETPETREKAIKEEIRELLLRPVVEGRLQPLEMKVASAKRLLREMDDEYSRAKADWNEPDNVYQYKKDNWAEEFVTRFRVTKSERYWGYKADQLEHDIKNKVRETETMINEVELVIQRDRLAFETNRMIIDETLHNVHDEAALRGAFAEIQTLFGSISEQSIRTPMASEIHHPLAQKILGYYKQYGVRTHGSSRYDIGEISPIEQSYGKKIERHNQIEPRNLIALETLSHDAYVTTHAPELRVPGNSHVTVNRIAEAYTHAKNERDPDDHTRALLAKRPTLNDFAAHFYSGQAKFWNLNRAYQAIDAKLSGKPSTPEALPEELAAGGWRVSVQGAFVEPGQNSRDVDREYIRVLEQLSKPQFESEKAFDLRGPEGEFHVYTIAQSLDLLQRARRDAGLIIKEMTVAERTAKETQTALESKIGSLEEEVVRLKNQMHADQDSSTARENVLKDELVAANKTAKAAEKKAREQEAASRAAQGKIETVRGQLAAALQKKGGLFGGDKELRSAVEAAMSVLRGDT